MEKPEAAYYYLSGVGGTVGPLSLGKMRELRATGTIFDSTLVRLGSEGGWLPLVEQPGLKENSVEKKIPASVEGVHLIKARGVSALLFLLLAGGMVVEASWLVLSGKGSNVGFLPLLLVFMPIAATFALLAWWVWSSSLTISDDSIERKDFLGTRRLAFDAIAGFRTFTGNRDAYLIFMPKEKTEKAIRISDGYADSAKIFAWAADRFENLDAEQAVKVTEEILADPTLGATPEQREARLALAKKMVGFSTVLVSVVTMWGWIWPHPYVLAMAALPLVSILHLSWFWIFRGCVVFDGTNADPRPNVSAFFIPLLALSGRAFFDFTPLAVWWYLALPCALMGVIAASALPFHRNKSGWIGVAIFPGIVLFAGFCLYGVLMESDCLLDSSAPQSRTVRVLSSHITHSNKGGTHYYVTVSGLSEFPNGKQFAVTYSFFHAVSREDPLTVVIHSGFWGIPWGELELPPAASGSWKPTLREAAQAGDPRAEGRLASAYYYGRGVPKDYVQALAWYQKGAFSGDIDSQSMLSYIYLTGTGTPCDYMQAMEWAKKAAAVGNAAAQQNMGWMYEKGLGVPANRIVAYAIYRVEARGNAPGNQGARSTDDLRASMSSEDVKKAEVLAEEMGRPGQFLSALEAFAGH